MNKHNSLLTTTVATAAVLTVAGGVTTVHADDQTPTSSATSKTAQSAADTSAKTPVESAQQGVKMRKAMSMRPKKLRMMHQKMPPTLRKNKALRNKRLTRPKQQRKRPKV